VGVFVGYLEGTVARGAGALAGGFILATAYAFTLLFHFYYFRLQRMGMSIRVALTALIYTKVRSGPPLLTSPFKLSTLHSFQL
jgi:hypothetical protein